MTALRAELGRFYSALAPLWAMPGQGRCLREHSGRSSWPKRGVYFFFEAAEHRSTAQEMRRVVRVGTHAVSVDAKSSLWSRLRAHRGGRSGNGNHRGSIFRLHVGAAILARDGQELSSWGVGGSAGREVRAPEAPLEARVSIHIGAMSVLWVDVPDEPGPMSARAFIERNAIALLSNRLSPDDPPSSSWLGQHSPSTHIRRSGLWNLRHVEQDYDPAFLRLLQDAVTATTAR
jgi:hypothetical protein